MKQNYPRGYENEEQRKTIKHKTKGYGIMSRRTKKKKSKEKQGKESKAWNDRPACIHAKGNKETKVRSSI
jgi:hypothetical protein